ncbi:MAG TPA: FixH family protein [Polyangiaceae bacterium]|jgi:hypothetical protein|nr:FixH family protein [Polyangiaceae bacterium]
MQFISSSVVLTLAVCGSFLACSSDGMNMPPDTGSDTTGAALGDSCSKETRAPAFSADLSFSNTAGFTVKLLDAQPAPPKLGDNTWTVELDDASGMPIERAKIAFSQLMIDHGHGGAKTPKLAELGGGRYSLSPVNFNMPGYWENYLKVSTDAIDTKLTIKVCATD